MEEIEKREYVTVWDEAKEAPAVATALSFKDKIKLALTIDSTAGPGLGDNVDANKADRNGTKSPLVKAVEYAHNKDHTHTELAKSVSSASLSFKDRVKLALEM